MSSNEEPKKKPISVKARKAKARALQVRIKEDLKRIFHLSDNDCRSTPMGVNGPDIQLSDDARRKYNFSIECKASNALNIWDAMNQAKANAELNGNTPQLIFKRDKEEPYVCMLWSDWLKMISR